MRANLLPALPGKRVREREGVRPVFLFPGQGAQYAGDGAGAVRDPAGVSGGAGGVRVGVAGGAGFVAAGGVVGRRRTSSGADGEYAAGTVCGGVCASASVAELGDPACSGAGPQRGRVRSGVYRRGVQPGRWTAVDRGAWPFDAGRGRSRRDAGSALQRSAGAGGVAGVGKAGVAGCGERSVQCRGVGIC